MPGKVNPSVPEAVQMVCFQVRGADHVIELAAAAGELELNVMTPVVAFNLAESFEVLTRGIRLLRERCIEGLVVNRARVRGWLAGSLVEATALSPYLGYEVTAELVKNALATGHPLRETVATRGLLDRRSLDRLLAPRAITGPQPLDRRLRRRVHNSPAYRAARAALALPARNKRLVERGKGAILR
jgi:aspartate ammonia-lyase